MSPDKLLETHTVAQAEVVAAQLTREVDRKREELRVMVGERYRDLIEAADTIHQMRQCTSSVIQSLSTMHSSCNGLRGARISKQDAQHLDRQQLTANTSYLAVAAGIKLLTILPEQIWAAVERSSWSEAAELYQLSSHVHTGLNTDHGAGITHDKISAWFPVINRQWDVIQQLHSSLISNCQAQLSKEKLSEPAAVDCLLALMLLTKSSASQIFSTFLKCRTESLKSVLTKCRSESAVVGVSSVATCVQSTLMTIQYAAQHLTVTLTSISQSTDPTLAKISSSILGPTARYLTNPVKQFSPKISKSTIQEVSAVNVTHLVQEWLVSALKITQGEIKSLLKFVDSVDGLKKVKDGTDSVLCDDKSEANGQIAVWDLLFKELVADRMMEIVSGQLESMMATATADLDQMLSCNNDVQDYIWSDTPGELGHVWGKGKAEKMGLMMKCSGWSVKLQEIWRNLDFCLEKMIESLQDHQEILSQSKEVSYTCVNGLINHVSEEVGHSDHVSRARVLQSLIPLTPNITKILSTNFDKVKQQIDQRMTKLLTQWIESLVKQMTIKLEELKPSSCLECLPAWDQVKISETGDSGEVVSSTISVPSSPSLPLVTCLFDTCTRVHAQHPTSLPLTTLVTANTMCLDALAASYQSLSEQTLTQNFALQLLFDVNFIQTLLVSRENKDHFTSRLNNLISGFEANIDPFDLSVFTPHLQERVKTSCARLGTGFACLVPKDRVAVISSYKSTSSDNHNILNVSTQSCSRFQLLPLSSSVYKPAAAILSSSPAAMQKMLSPALISLDTDSTGSTSNKSPRFDTKSVQQSAANFFGSMSWFGNTS